MNRGNSVGRSEEYLLYGYAHSSTGPTTGAYRRLRPLSTRRFGQPRRLGSRRASSPSGARAGGLSGKPCACSPAPLPPLSLPSFRRALPLPSCRVCLNIPCVLGQILGKMHPGCEENAKINRHKSYNQYRFVNIKLSARRKTPARSAHVIFVFGVPESIFSCWW